jgi:hypothetical protein
MERQSFLMLRFLIKFFQVNFGGSNASSFKSINLDDLLFQLGLGMSFSFFGYLDSLSHGLFGFNFSLGNHLSLLRELLLVLNFQMRVVGDFSAALYLLAILFLGDFPQSHGFSVR